MGGGNLQDPPRRKAAEILETRIEIVGVVQEGI